MCEGMTPQNEQSVCGRDVELREKHPRRLVNDPTRIFGVGLGCLIA